MKETLEEAAERLYPINKKGAMFMPTRFDLNRDLKRDGFIECANWQSERMYSEEDIKLAFDAGHKKGFSGYPNTENWKALSFIEWFSQFKKGQ